ncbi:subtilisin-like serine protease precursor [Moelleriella libera RCEF 2490]|uniref:Subtilisin-like serine protease n=1 Tax=Moelleriella libera RCEF 2490 TaxID=1081109 RepID=A0A162I6Q3_9HYPO|nr:subtilisin-like serine protease precursor [Moelleriella libera RCEF 2490]
MRLLAPHLFASLALGVALRAGSGEELAAPSLKEDIRTTYIISFKAGTPPSVRSQVMQELGDDSDLAKFNHVFLGFGKPLSPAEVELVRSHPHVHHVEEDQGIFTAGYIEQKNSPWGLGRISHRNRGATDYVYDEIAGNGTCTYVIDTGIDDTHPPADLQRAQDFGGRAKQIKSFLPGPEVDENGHGTHVAGIIGGATHGVAKQTLLYGVKILGQSTGGTAVDLIRGLDFVMKDKEQRHCPKGVMVNLSVGGPQHILVDFAAAELVRAGAFVGVAAMNNNTDARLFSPCFEPSVCLVGGTDENDQPFFTKGEGGEKDKGTNWGPQIDVFAPAAHIISTWPGGGRAVMTGTSQACPHVVGLAAYLASIEGLTGTEPLCGRIRDLASKGIIQNLQKNTPNLLAFNGVITNNKTVYPPSPSQAAHWEWSEATRERMCLRFDRLLLYFEVSSDSWAGTKSTVSMEFPGASIESHVIKGAPEPSFHEWQEINLVKVFGARSIAFNSIKQLALISSPEPKVSKYGPDSWKISRIILRAQCENSSLWLENGKFASFNKALNPWSGITHVAWKDSTSLGDWIARPFCSHLKLLQVTIKISNSFFAGTDNDLFLLVGVGRFPLAHHPSRNEVYTAYVNLLQAFGSYTVAIQEISRIAILSLGGKDKVLPEEVIIHASCDGPENTPLEITRLTETWIADGESWEIRITSDEWEKEQMPSRPT